MTNEQKAAAIFFIVVFVTMGVLIGWIGRGYVETPPLCKCYYDCNCKCEPPIDLWLWPDEIKWTINQPTNDVYNFFVPGGPDAPEREAREDMEE